MKFEVKYANVVYNEELFYQQIYEGALELKHGSVKPKCAGLSCVNCAFYDSYFVSHTKCILNLSSAKVNEEFESAYPELFL